MAIASVVFDIRAGVAKLNQDFANAEKRVSAGMQKISSVVRRATVAIAAYMGVRAVVGFANQVTQLGDDLDKMSQRTGVSAEALQGFQYGVEQSGGSVDNLQRALRNLSERIGETAAGSERFTERYERFGVALTDAAGQARDSADVLMDIADVLSSMDDGAEKTEAAMKLLGVNAGPRLLPFLNQGSQGLREFQREAESMGIVLSNEAVQALSNFSTNLGRLRSAQKGWGQSVMAGLAQPLEAVTERMLEAGAGSEKYAKITEVTASVAGWLTEMIDVSVGMFRKLFEAIFDGIPSVGGIGDAVKGVARVFKEFDVVLHTVAFTIRVVSTAGEIVGKVFTILGRTIGAAVASILAVLRGDFAEAGQIIRDLDADLTADAIEAWDRIKTTWTTSSKEIVGTAKEAGLGVSDALERIRTSGGSATKAMRDFSAETKAAGKAAAETAKDIEALARARLDAAIETDILIAQLEGNRVREIELQYDKRLRALDDQLEAEKITREDYARQERALEEMRQREITEYHRTEQAERDKIRQEALAKMEREREASMRTGFSIAEAFTDGFRSVFESDSFQSIMRGILGMFARVASFIPGGQAASLGAGLFAGFFRDGGMVHGPGGPKGDKILARVSDGEFINTAQAVNTFGSRFFERLNEGVLDLDALPRYAGGGIVGSAPTQAPAIAGQASAPTVYIQAFDPRSTEDALAQVWEPAQYRRGMNRQDSKTTALMRRRLGVPRTGR